MPTRRRFLQWAGVGAAASLATSRSLAKEPAIEEKRPTKAASERAYQLGLASYTLRKFPLDRALAMTQRVGLKHICLKDFCHLPQKSTPEEIAKAVAKVKAAGIDLYAGGGIALRTPAQINQAFPYAKAAGMRVIIGMLDPATLPLVNEKVQEYDIRVALHNHGPDDKVFRTPEEGYKAIKNLDRRIGLCIDIGHTLRSGVDPCLSAERVADRLMDVHVKDVDAASKAGKCVEAGHGLIDLPKFFRTLDKIRFAGIVSFEFEKDPDDPLPGLAESVGYVRGVLDGI